MEAILAEGNFVLLVHQGKGPDHYDLILDGNQLCPTFQFEQIDLCKGLRIKDHQKKYLNFEGIISPEKGSVHLTDKGKFFFSNQNLQLIGQIKNYSFSVDAENILISI